MSRELPRGLVVSCQALKSEPMYGGDSIAKMARAAVLGGASGIRANTVRDIKMIASRVSVPIIGLIKQDYEGSAIYITPTLKEVKSLIKSPCDIIAMDATARVRPGGATVRELVTYIRRNSDKRIMADVATIDEAEAADELGFDYVSSTLRGYTEDTRQIAIPDLGFLREMASRLKHSKPVAEGGIQDNDTITQILLFGYETVIIGGAITRPMEITKRYMKPFLSINSSMTALKQQ